MEDKFLKYSKLYIIIFLLFLSVPVIIGLLVVSFYGLSKLAAMGPLDTILQLLMIALMPAIFSAAYVTFFKRTKQHPSAVVRAISMIVFVICTLLNIFFLVKDIISFFKGHDPNISVYYSLSLTSLAGNMGILFLIAIIQAFTTKKEVDWMERHR